ncbi:MAG TPA: sigma-70 family RNA polymerase sigma factor [Streptosporangiaceae bacterium]
MDKSDLLAEGFEKNRARLRAVAYRMLGSQAEADDAVQDAWLRLSRSDASGVDNLAGWLTIIVARVCLDVLRLRNARREGPVDTHVPDPVISQADETGPEDAALLADSVGLALHAVLDTLLPDERLAFVLHDVFDVSYAQIAPMAGYSPAKARQLVSQARRRVRPADAPAPESDTGREREVVDAFFAAASHGDFDALIAVLDPDVVLRSDAGTAQPEDSVLVHGAAAVASRAIMFHQPSALVRPALVDGAAGVVVTMGGRPVSAMSFFVSRGKIAEIDVVGDPERLLQLNLAII